MLLPKCSADAIKAKIEEIKSRKRVVKIPNTFKKACNDGVTYIACNETFVKDDSYYDFNIKTNMPEEDSNQQTRFNFALADDFNNEHKFATAFGIDKEINDNTQRNDFWLVGPSVVTKETILTDEYSICMSARIDLSSKENVGVDLFVGSNKDGSNAELRFDIDLINEKDSINNFLDLITKIENTNEHYTRAYSYCREKTNPVAFLHGYDLQVRSAVTNEHCRDLFGNVRYSSGSATAIELFNEKNMAYFAFGRRISRTVKPCYDLITNRGLYIPNLKKEHDKTLNFCLKGSKIEKEIMAVDAKNRHIIDIIKMINIAKFKHEKVSRLDCIFPTFFAQEEIDAMFKAFEVMRNEMMKKNR